MGQLTERDRRPLPLRVRDEILALIADDGLVAGDQLPTEMAIAERFGVGRTTAREALKLLEQDGIVDVRHGLGRYVSQMATLERPITRLESVTELMESLGHRVSNRVASVAVRAPSPDEAQELALSPGEEVLSLERVRLHDAEPLIYSIDVLPRRLLPEPLDEVDWTGSLFELLEARGVRVSSAIAQVQAVVLPIPARSIVGDDSGRPWVLLTHRNLDDAGRTVAYSHDYYRGDRFAFNVLRRRRD
jgi:GntR family transcriptional regulator